MEERFNGDGWDGGRNDPMRDSAPIADENLPSELDAMERMYDRRGNENAYGVTPTSFLQRGVASFDTSSFSPLSDRPSSSSSHSCSPSRFARPIESGSVPPLPPEMWTDIIERTTAGSLLTASLVNRENRQIALRNASERRRKKMQRVLEIMESEMEMYLLFRYCWENHDHVMWREKMKDPQALHFIQSMSLQAIGVVMNEKCFLSEGSAKCLMHGFMKDMEGGGDPISMRLRMLCHYLSHIVYVTKHKEIVEAWSLAWGIDHILLSIPDRNTESEGEQKYELTISLDNGSTSSYGIGNNPSAKPVLRIGIPQHGRNDDPHRLSDPYEPSDDPSRPFVDRLSPTSGLVTICSRMSGILFSYITIEHS